MVKEEIAFSKGKRQWQGIPAIEISPEGRLWVACFSGGPKEPHPENFILLSTREKSSEKWSEPEIFISPGGSTRAYDPSLWHDPEGKLWMFYNLASLETRDFSIHSTTASDSGAASPAWSKPVKIELGVPFAFRINKPVVISSGEWLLPVTWAAAAPPDWWHPMDGQLQGVAISGDSGATWELHGAVEAPHWALENMVVELADGRLWMLIRVSGGVLWESFSFDRGRTWTGGRPAGIPNPGGRFFIGRLACGRLLLINTFNSKKREGLRACVSARDDEQNFGPGIELDPREGVSYPDAAEGEDGLIYAVHDFDRYGAGDIIVNVFSSREAAGDR